MTLLKRRVVATDDMLFTTEGELMRNRTTCRTLMVGLCLLVSINALGAPSESAPLPPNCPPPATDLVPKDGWEAAARRATDHGVLWRIEKDGRTSWLYGTIHVARPEWILPGPIIRNALKQSDAIALELDVLDKDFIVQLRERQTNEDRHLLVGRRGARLNRLFDTTCLPTSGRTLIRSMRPGMQLAVLEGLSMRADGLYPDFGVDLVLEGFAKSAHLPVEPLETVSEQLRVMNDMGPANEAARSFDLTLDQIGSGKARADILKLANAWAESDLDTLAHYPQWCDCLNTSGERLDFEHMVTNRNLKMAEKISSMHTSGQRIFAAVGALHMIGPQGIPALLAARGFVVTSVLPAAVGE
uniref:TraB/GumN family protein n=1 Tax=Burkholderia arboris TaxID=488730 RepID=UPI003BEEC20A